MELNQSVIVQLPSPSPAPQSISWYQEPITIATFALATVIVNIVGIYKSWADLQNHQKLFVEGQNTKERDDIRYKLDNFFGPLKEIRVEARILYDVFALSEKEGFRGKGSCFRTVTD
jgi:hypothetical protein